MRSAYRASSCVSHWFFACPAVVFGSAPEQKALGVGAAMGGPLVLAALVYAERLKKPIPPLKNI